MLRILGVALVVVPLGVLQAQRPAAARNPTWITVGVGQATWGGITEMGSQLTLSHQTGKLVMTGRALLGFDILGGVLAPPGTVIDVRDFGFTLGIGNHPGVVRYSLGAGLGVTTVTRTAGSQTNKKSTVGFPLESQLFFQPFRFVGVGLYGYGDLNKERSFWGWSISVALGRLR